MSTPLEKIGRLFYTVRSDELKEAGEQGLKRTKLRMSEEIEGDVGGEGGRTQEITEYRIEELEEQADENTTIAHKNKKLLGVIDERTAWIMRILVGIFIAIMGSVLLNFTPV